MKSTTPYLVIIFFLLVSHINLNAQVDLKKGLIAYYPFNVDAKDASGDGNHGTVYGAKLEQDARCGSPAYVFDGDDDYIDFGNDATLNENFQGLTISTWVRPMRINQEEFGFIMGKWAFDEERDQFAVFFTTKNTLDFTIGDGYDFGYGTYTVDQLENHAQKQFNTRLSRRFALTHPTPTRWHSSGCAATTGL